MGRRAARFLATLVLVAVVALQSGWALSKCMSDDQFEAERVRALQSALMVAALKCVYRPDLRLEQNYNDFALSFRKELVAQSYVLQDYFRRTYGGSHRYHLNRYLTNLANKYSSLTFDVPDFCEAMSDLGQSIIDEGEGAIIDPAFDTSALTAPIALPCRANNDPARAFLHRKVPDLVSIHMPDLDMVAREEAQIHSFGGYLGD